MVIFLLGAIKMFLEFPGLLELKVIYGMEVKDGVSYDSYGNKQAVVTDKSIKQLKHIIEKRDEMESILKADIDEENQNDIFFFTMICQALFIIL